MAGGMVYCRWLGDVLSVTVVVVVVVVVVEEIDDARSSTYTQA